MELSATADNASPNEASIASLLEGGAISGQPFWLHNAVHGLRRARPEFSAAVRPYRWQRRTLATLAVLVPVSVLALPSATLAVGLAVLTLPFLCAGALRVHALWYILTGREVAADVVVDRSGATGADLLPSYSVLVALYNEADVAPALVRAMAALQYPVHKLEILFVTEADDEFTRRALAHGGLGANMRVLTVPEGEPQTKPRALNFALAVASGELIAVYDAEDIPEPDQLLLAAAALASGPEPLACVQAKLNVYNIRQSLFTRQFTLEYSALFDAILPSLTSLGLPVPLGGTSNHFRRAKLDAAGGWDPFNVTEDADLGIRFARLGMSVGVIASTTCEEAPVTARVWFGQRTRWLKGWMQTYLVHMREPGRLLRELGLKRFAGFQVLMAGMILSALGHPVFLGVTAAAIINHDFFATPEAGFARAAWLLGLLNLGASYAAAIALSAVSSRRRGQGWLGLWSLLTPIYWLAISLAAWWAVVELLRSPYYWQKTAHSARPVTMGLAKS